MAAEQHPGIVTSRDQLRALLNAGPCRHYLYILKSREEGEERPFYVGIGQGLRLFSHEDEARDPSRAGRKVEAIRTIWKSGGEVVRFVEGFYPSEPWDREEELIREFGQLKHGTGPLTNEQNYMPSFVDNGVELRKYAEEVAGEKDRMPDNFKLMNTRLMAGPKEPLRRTTVFGKIYTVLEENPGITGGQLVCLLKSVDFSNISSPYTQNGEACAAWLCRYIEGGFFRADRAHVQEYRVDAKEGAR